jgi:hypothetical protein
MILRAGWCLVLPLRHITCKFPWSFPNAWKFLKGHDSTVGHEIHATLASCKRWGNSRMRGNTSRDSTVYHEILCMDRPYMLVSVVCELHGHNWRTCSLDLIHRCQPALHLKDCSALLAWLCPVQRMILNHLILNRDFKSKLWFSILI